MQFYLTNRISIKILRHKIYFLIQPLHSSNVSYLNHRCMVHLCLNLLEIANKLENITTDYTKKVLTIIYGTMLRYYYYI